MALSDILLTLARHDLRYITVGGDRGGVAWRPDHDAGCRRRLRHRGRQRGSALARARGARRNLPRRSTGPRPNASHLFSAGHELLRTNQELLDVSGTIETSTTYADLLPDASAVDVHGVPSLVLAVGRRIEVKRKLARPKERVMLIQLESLLDELQRPG